MSKNTGHFISFVALLAAAFLTSAAQAQSLGGYIKPRTPPPKGDSLGMGGFALSGGYVPLASHRTKITDNSMALPVDRVYFLHHHFHNALDSVLVTGGGNVTRSDSTNRYTVGFEKTLFHSASSIEVRMPFTERYSASAPVVDSSIQLGDVGNLSVTYKEKVYENATTVWSVGLGSSLPTGSDVTGTEGGERFRIDNHAVHLLPFVGLMHVPNERLFCHGFVQLDVPTNGNRLTNLVTGETETVRDHALMYFDVATGYWLHRAPSQCGSCARGVTGVAAMLELHYTTSIQDPDPGTILLYVTERVDILNLTTTLHVEVRDNIAFRLAGVFPLKRTSLSADPGGVGPITVRGPFDAEVQASVIYQF